MQHLFMNYVPYRQMDVMQKLTGTRKTPLNICEISHVSMEFLAVVTINYQ